MGSIRVCSLGGKIHTILHYYGFGRRICFGFCVQIHSSVIWRGFFPRKKKSHVTSLMKNPLRFCRNVDSGLICRKVWTLDLDSALTFCMCEHTLIHADFTCERSLKHLTCPAFQRDHLAHSSSSLDSSYGSSQPSRLQQ